MGFMDHPPVADRIVSGQKGDVTSAASPLSAASIKCGAVYLVADSVNSDSIFWGSADGQYNELAPGQREFIAISDVAKVYVRAGSGTQTANYNALD